MKCELLRPRIEKTPYVGEECVFTPSEWMTIGENSFPVGYKVVTCDLKSLGLRKNPNIMTFPLGEWIILPDDEVEEGNGDWGGIWTALNKGSINTLKNYMMEKYKVKTRAFRTALYRPVYANSYRIKSQGVMLFDEVL